MNSQDLIRRVIRGEAHWSSLREIGFEIDLRAEQGRREWKQGRCPASVPLQASDVMVGITNLRARPAELSEWASFLWACDGVDFSALDDDSPRNEAIKDAIWRLAFGEDAEPVISSLAEISSLSPEERAGPR